MTTTSLVFSDEQMEFLKGEVLNEMVEGKRKTFSVSAYIRDMVDERRLKRKQEVEAR